MSARDNDKELLDYDEDEADDVDMTGIEKAMKGTHVSMHSPGFRDFLLKPELLRSIMDCGFEHPSEGRILCGDGVHVRLCVNITYVLLTYQLQNVCLADRPTILHFEGTTYIHGT
jgi:hypothetical protein